MSQKYTPQEIEPKWQQTWAEQALYKTVEDPSRPKWYALTMLPYPSGDLHTGPLVCLYAQRCRRALAAHEWLQRLLPDRL